MSDFACALAMARWPLSLRYTRGINWLYRALSGESSEARRRLCAGRLRALLLASDIIRSARIRY